MDKEELLLVGDVGATYTRLALYLMSAAVQQRVSFAEYQSAKYSRLEDIARDFLANRDVHIARACFGIAGPVVVGRADLPNLGWTVTECELADALNTTSVKLVNDLEATAVAIPHMQPSDLLSIGDGQPVKHGAMAVIAPGTGLGEAYLTWAHGNYQPHASEGGWADFAPTDSLEIGLLQYLLSRMESVSYTHVCSGIGIPNIYSYLRDTGLYDEPPWLRERLATLRDRTPLIIEAAMDDANAPALCTSTIDVFLKVLGAEAGNLALKVLATGGVYIAGGIPLHILPALQKGTFLQAFRRKAACSRLLSRIPIHVICNRYIPLEGLARIGFVLGNG